MIRRLDTESVTRERVSPRPLGWVVGGGAVAQGVDEVKSTRDRGASPAQSESAGVVASSGGLCGRDSLEVASGHESSRKSGGETRFVQRRRRF